MSEPTKVQTKKRAPVMAFAPLTSNAPEVNDSKYLGKPWVPCGTHNLFREFLRALADNCSPLNTVVNIFALYFAGKRFIFRDAAGEEVVRASQVWNALHMEDGESYFRRALAKDIALLGDRSFEIVMNRMGQPAALYHLDAMRLRVGHKEDGRIKNFYWCSNWFKSLNGYSKQYPIQTLNAFGSDGMSTTGKGVMFARDYHQGQDYYGLPMYLPALTDAEVFTAIARFNLTQIRTGFKAGTHVHMKVANRDEYDMDQVNQDFRNVYTREDGDGLIVTMGNDQEEVTITRLERGDHAGELDKMGDRAEQVIYKACGLPPILAGVDVSTGLSGKGLALDQSVTQFLRTQIVPRQWMLTDAALRIVQMCGVTEAVTCEVEQLIPFDPAADPALVRQTYLRSHTVNEDRLLNGLGKLTTDGEPEKADGSNLDPRGFLLLIEAGGAVKGANEDTGEPSEDTKKQDANG